MLPGECCPLPSRCVCDPAGCLRKVCQPGYLNILVSKASGKPGECCDLYECKPVFSVDCSTVECPLSSRPCAPWTATKRKCGSQRMAAVPCQQDASVSLAYVLFPFVRWDLLPE